MTRLKWYLYPTSPHQLKKQRKNVKVGPPLTKLSGSAHEKHVYIEEKDNFSAKKIYLISQPKHLLCFN